MVEGVQQRPVLVGTFFSTGMHWVSHYLILSPALTHHNQSQGDSTRR